MSILRSVGPYIYRLTLENMQAYFFEKSTSVTVWTDTLITILGGFLLQPPVSTMELK